ncbi:MAG: thermonuclease family protein [Gemmobacter sp.]
MLTTRSWLVLAAALLAAAPMLALDRWPAQISGIGHVIDGDTLDVGDTRVRLAVVDAPERGQSCDLRGKPMACGEAARFALQGMAEGRQVTCDVGPKLSHARVVGLCRVGGEVLNLALLETGLGVVAEKYLAEWPDHAEAMVAAEARARQARRGLWAMHAVPPAAWRAERRQGLSGAAEDCPPDRPVKANISDNGRIYHVPGSKHYAKTRISKPGEACVASAAEAEAMGFRAALG